MKLPPTQVLKSSLATDSFLILSSFLFTTVWIYTPLQTQTIPLIGILALIYILTHTKLLRYIPKNITTSFWEKLNLFALHTTVLLLISTTGNTNSPLFFLLYFLAFSISFTLTPAAVFPYTLAACILFAPLPPLSDITQHTLKLASLFLIAPLAYLFGKDTQIAEKKQEQFSHLQKQAAQTSRQIAKDITTLIQTEGQTLDETEIKTLKDIMTQTRQLEKETKNTL
jgi:hypothetical protein